jgi:hypothetical protein
MATNLRIENLWVRLRGLCARRGPRLVAVPFVGQGASKRLCLRAGDLLVTRCDLGAVRAGLTDPKEIVKYISAGVEVHSAAALHAKVFVLGRAAIVGSSNVSSASETQLIEAGIESDDPRVVRACSGFVRELRGDVVGLEEAKRLVASYRPPRGTGGPKQRRPRTRLEPGQTPLWALGLTRCDYEDEDSRQSTAAEADARQRMSSRRTFRLDEFLWTGRVPFRVRDRVIMCTEESRNKILVDPPARVLAVRAYKSRGRHRAIVWVELRTGLRRRSARQLESQIGPSAGILRRVHGARRISSQGLAYALGQVWPGVVLRTG